MHRFAHVVIDGIAHVTDDLHGSGKILVYADIHRPAYRILPVEVGAGECLVDNTSSRQRLRGTLQSRRNIAPPKVAPIDQAEPHRFEEAGRYVEAIRCASLDGLTGDAHVRG